jgi:hypothetical protein
MTQLFFPAKIGGHEHPITIATEVKAPAAAGWRVPWYFDCRHNSEWRLGDEQRTMGDHGAVPVVDTQDTLQDSLGSAWGCLPGDGTNGTMIKNDQSIFK